MIHLCHGIRVADRGAATVGRIEPLLEERGLEHQRLSYPWTFLLTQPRNSRWAVEELADRARPGDGVIAHSNGCWIAVQAAEIGAPLDWLILVNPALHPRHEMPRQLREVHVWFSPGDVAVRAGRFWRAATRILPWRWSNRHPFGAMGAVGYTSTDRRVYNHLMPRSLGHSGVWRDDYWLGQIAELAVRLSGASGPTTSSAQRTR